MMDSAQELAHAVAASACCLMSDSGRPAAEPGHERKGTRRACATGIWVCTVARQMTDVKELHISRLARSILHLGHETFYRLKKCSQPVKLAS